MDERTGDGLQQLLGGEGFGQARPRACQTGTDAREETAAVREDEDRHGGKPGVSFDERTDLEAIQSRHPTVEKQQVGLDLGQHSQRIEAVDRHLDAITGIAQEFRGEATRGLAVGGQQDADIAPRDAGDGPRVGGDRHCRHHP